MSEPATQAGELDALIGTTVADRYRVDDLLGVGGMGAVFRARHLLLKRDVAVKVLHPSLSGNEDLSRRFDREAQSAARLDHPNIIQVSEFGSTADGMKYMVMPVLHGMELMDLIEGPMDPLRAVDLEIQILRGLEHAHQNGVVHRDLKPENVFVTTDHEDEEILKLVDFGIAKILDEEIDEEGVTAQPLTRLGLIFGTPQYMSPEQATGSEIDHRTDIYSAGVILYHMLAGKIPFDNEDPVALIRMQVTLDPPALSEVPSILEEVVLKMMAKTRDERFPDARSARKALEDVHSQLAREQGLELKFSSCDTGIVDPRDIYPPGHEALTQNPAFASSGSGSVPQLGAPGSYNPSEYSSSRPNTGPLASGSGPLVLGSGSGPLALGSGSGPLASGSGPLVLGSGPLASDSTVPPVAPLGGSTARSTISLADALTSSHPSLQDSPSPFAARLAALPPTYYYIGGGVLALLLLIALWPSGSEGEGESDSDSASVAASAGADTGSDTGADTRPVVTKVSAETLVEIDRALSSKNSDDSLKLIQPELDKSPEDPQLIWRYAKAMSFKKTKSDRVIALDRYGEAYELDPTLIDDTDFYAELYALLNNTQLRDQAINVAVQKLGPTGHKFLIEQVNNTQRSLGWFDRHRVLEVLGADAEAKALVDWKLNLRRDLEKAEHAPQPCTAFAAALDEIAASKDEYFVDSVFTVKPPPPGTGEAADLEDAKVCEVLEAKQLVVRELMGVAQPEASAKYLKKKKKKRRR